MNVIPPQGKIKNLKHFDEKGNTRMVDVGGKEETLRIAVARGHITAHRETLRLIAEQKMKKGDVLEVARLAGIMAAKRTGELIPLCHPLALTSIRVELAIADDDRSRIEIEAEIQTIGRTGVEMEALTAVSVAALTVYDMCKAVDREMVIADVRLVKRPVVKVVILYPFPIRSYLREDTLHINGEPENAPNTHCHSHGYSDFYNSVRSRSCADHRRCCR